MPRIVDHDQRRRELATAVWRVISRDGVDAASVRAVAAESGWSTGAIRHYFTSQDDLLRFAAQLMMERVPERLQGHLGNPALTPFDRVRLALEETLPLDDERRVECLVYYAFADRSRTDHELAVIRRIAWDGLRYLARLAVAHLHGAEPPAELTEPLPDPSWEQAAARLHALTDGLAIQGLHNPDRLPPEEIRALLTGALHALRA